MDFTLVLQLVSELGCKLELLEANENVNQSDN